MHKVDKKNSSNNLKNSVIQAEDDTIPFLDDYSVMSSYQTGKKTGRTAALPQYYGNTESHQYEPDESEVWRHHQLLRWRSL